VVALALPSVAAAEEWDVDERGWGPNIDEYIDARPGQLATPDGGSTCSTNFVFSDGTRHFLGLAARCASPTPNATDGCTADPGRLGRVDMQRIDNRIGPWGMSAWLVYSSWKAMQDAGETDPQACRHNDFALIEINEPREDISPTVPYWRGPQGVAASAPPLSDVVGYGGATYRLGAPVWPRPTRQNYGGPIQGTVLRTTAGGWSYDVAAATGLLQDTGAPILDRRGRALGLLSTPAGVTSIDRAVRYMHQHIDAFDAVTLQDSTLPFAGP